MEKASTITKYAAASDDISSQETNLQRGLLKAGGNAATAACEALVEQQRWVHGRGKAALRGWERKGKGRRDQWRAKQFHLFGEMATMESLQGH